MVPAEQGRVAEEDAPDTLVLVVMAPPCLPSTQPFVHAPEGGSAAPSVWLQLRAPPCLATDSATEMQREQCSSLYCTHRLCLKTTYLWFVCFKAGVMTCVLSHLELPLQLLYLCPQRFRLS